MAASKKVRGDAGCCHSLARPKLGMRDVRSRMEPTADDLLGLGIYSVPEASRLTRIPPRRLRRWLRGYHFVHAGERHFSSRVITGELPEIEGALALSFLDLQEARCINEFRERGVGWEALREAHNKAVREMRTRHPFSTGQFKNIGRKIMWDYATESGDKVLLDLAMDQRTFRDLLAPLLRGLEFVNRQPVRWFPLDKSRRVVLDPKRGFGRPIVAKRGVATSILFQAYRAERTYEKVARWYEVDVASVRDAVRYEKLLAA